MNFIAYLIAAISRGSMEVTSLTVKLPVEKNTPDKAASKRPALGIVQAQLIIIWSEAQPPQITLVLS